MNNFRACSLCSNLSRYENETNRTIRFQFIHSGSNAATQSADVSTASPARAGNRSRNGLKTVAGIFLPLDYAHKVALCAGIDGKKWPRGQYDVPETRACRSRKQHSDSASAEQTYRNDAPKGIRLNSGVARTERQPRPSLAVCQRRHITGLQDDRSPLATATVTQCVETITDTTVYTAGHKQHATPLSGGVVRFQPLSTITRMGIKQ